MFNLPTNISAKEKAQPSAFELVPANSADYIESITWHHKIIAFKASGGDLTKYDELYRYTDWATVYELYILRGATNYG